MINLEIGRTYIFVRATADGIEHTEFACHADSAGFVADGAYHVFEFSKDPAGEALAALSKLGFIELQEAQAANLVPESWSPSPESFVLKRQVVAAQQTVPRDRAKKRGA